VDEEHGDSKVLPPLSAATNQSDDEPTNTNVDGEESFALGGNSPNSPKNSDGSVNSEKPLKVDG
jgi:hypothetical protein